MLHIYETEFSSQHNFPNDSVAMMEFYMKKAAQEDLRKPLKHCKDEMPPTPSLQPPPCKPMPSKSLWRNFDNSYTCVYYWDGLGTCW